MTSPPWLDAGAPVAAGTHEVPVTMEEIPAYLRAGHIIPRRERARRSTVAMHSDPITLVIPLPSPSPGNPPPPPTPHPLSSPPHPPFPQPPIPAAHCLTLGW